MDVTVGTFNLNNLFSRFNFSVEVDRLPDAATEITVTYRLDDPSSFRLRRVQGALIKRKDDKDRVRVAARIAEMDVDVLALQEVEDILTLQQFNEQDLLRRYPYQVLVEGNDQRLIDVALLSRLPIGAVTSWRHAVHPVDVGSPVFSRDLLEVEILDPRRAGRLFTIFNNHLKSRFVPFGEDPVAGAAQAAERRRRQAEAAATIIAARTRPDSRYVVVGDMNDPPESPALAPLVGDPRLGLVNALQNPIETPHPLKRSSLPPSPTWTHRFKPAGKPAEFELFDQIWLSRSLARRLVAARIHRRHRLTRDGTDHDPASVVLRF